MFYDNYIQMIDRTTKLRWRRRFRRSQKQIEVIGSGAEQQLDRHLFRRLGRLYEVRRFILSWLFLVIILIGGTIIQTRALGGYYLGVRPVAGGIYSEGMVGSFTNANPIFASSEVDDAVSRLLFSSLMTYDNENRLVGDLAKSISVDATGKVYTLVLRDKLKWHDKVDLTSADVVFTYQAIQNPDIKSPLFSSWQGIVVAAPNAHTVVMTLPGVLASFPHSLTNGIIPKHLLGSVEPGSLRSAPFNTTQPIGSGPFKWGGVEVRGNNVEDREQRLSLEPNPSYYLGRPKLGEFIIRTYLNEKRMIQSFDEGALTGMAGIEQISDEQKKQLDISEYSIPVTGAVMAFLRTTQDFLKDTNIRQALAAATNQNAVLTSLEYPSIASTGPLLRGMIGYDLSIKQPAFNVDAASAQLEKAGWIRGADGVRLKDGKKLSLTITTLSNVEYASVASLLQKQWNDVGVDATVRALNQRDLQTAINGRGYDVLLYGITLGTDPDQFAYWHSSQADARTQRRLNFSDYSSKAADSALEAGRTRIDPTLRAAKYRPFLEAWRNDVPAIALYQPRFLYVTHNSIFNFNVRNINSPADRFVNVHNWMVRTERATVKD